MPKREATNVVVIDRFVTPHKTDPVSVAFGGNMRELLPTMDEIPSDFKRGSGKWQKFQSDWFFGGLKGTSGLKAQPGIDRDEALSHLACIQRSFEPKHEHKAAAVAYLASRWFDDSSTWQTAK